MPYRKVGTLEACWYILKGGVKEFVWERFKCPYKQVRTELPDGSILNTWELKEKKRRKQK